MKTVIVTYKSPILVGCNASQDTFMCDLWYVKGKWVIMERFNKYGTAKISACVPMDVILRVEEVKEEEESESIN